MRAAHFNTASVAILCLAFAGCAAGVKSVLFDPAHPLAPKPSDATIQMFSTQRPACAFDEIGTVSAEGGSLLASDKITEALQRRAREMGGDAIVGLTQGSRPGGTVRTSSGSTTSSMTTLTGTVVKFRDSACTR